MPIDPRRLAAIQVQLDALRHEADVKDNQAISEALDHASAALAHGHTLLDNHGLYLQIPDGYHPPKGLGGCGSSGGG